MPRKIQRKVQPVVRQAAPVAAPGAPSPNGKAPLFGGRRVSGRSLSEFTSQLATLLDAGIPIVRCLRVLEGQLRPGLLKRVLSQTTEDVESGTSLSDSLAKHPRVFDRLYTNMVRAGEVGGIQDTILNRLAAFMEKNQAIRGKIKGAMAYPVVVPTVAAGILVLVFTLVIPQFQTIFKTMQLDLPGITEGLIAVADHMKRWWWAYAFAVLGALALHFTLRARARPYRRATDALLLKLPLFGPLVKKTLVARFARTFGTLIQSGVPHLEALEIVKGSVPNILLEEAVDRIHASIKEGEGIARPMGASGIFDDVVVNMVDVGEETGELDRMLVKIADRYEVEVDRSVETVFKVIEPLLIVAMAVVVGVIVFALFIPLLKLMDKIK
jgi:type IV pilus assembly protein PilC